MSTDALADVARLDVLRSLRSGDIVWVTLRREVEEEEVEAVQRVLQTVIEADVSLIVTRHGYVENLQKMPLTELLRIQEAIEMALASYAEYQPTDQGV